STWKNKVFLLLWAANSLSKLTFVVFTFLLPIIIYEQTKSPFAMSLMRIIQVLPNVLLGLVIGILIDRSEKKVIMQTSVVIQILCVLLISAIINSDFSLWMLYLLSFILFSVSYLYGNAYYTVLPRIVSKDKLINSNSLINFVGTIIRISGPNFAGFVILMISSQYSLFITALCIFILFTIIYFCKIPKNTTKDPNELNIIQEIKEGISFLFKKKSLWYFTIVMCIMNVANALVGSILVFHSLDYLGVSITQLGIVLASSGIGAIFGPLTISYIKKVIGKLGIILLLAIFISLLGNVILFLSNNWLLVCVGMFIIGYSLSLISIFFHTLRQSETPEELLG